MSPCFSNLEADWRDYVDVVNGDLTEENCGITGDFKRLTDITHIIHCAATINFDSPLREATKHNIRGALNLLELARTLPNMQKFISTSTAYVTPGTSNPILEELHYLPFDCSSVLENIENGDVNEKELLRSTGHPNTYTLTKCIAEHLILERAKKCGFPVTIVRPSIISASEHYPFPGWIDSPATLAAFFIIIKTGWLGVLEGKRSTKLDSVPVDHVAANLIDEAFSTKNPHIVFSVATLKHSVDILSFGLLAEAHLKRGRSNA